MARGTQEFLEPSQENDFSTKVFFLCGSLKVQALFPTVTKKCMVEWKSEHGFWRKTECGLLPNMQNNIASQNNFPI